MRELLHILEQANRYYQQDVLCALATVVHIKGSGYRRKGTRMLISANGTCTGAVSGGCVEKEVVLQAQKVFKTRIPQLMTYDGRYRLGCEGTLYIFIELIRIKDNLLENFRTDYNNRRSVELHTSYQKEEIQNWNCRTSIRLQNKETFFNSENALSHDKAISYKNFTQVLAPAKTLYIFGAEHDAVRLCEMADLSGWDVTVVCHPLNSKDIKYFPNARQLVHLLPEELEILPFDSHTAAVFMSHSFSRDLAYLLQLVDREIIAYIGLLGPFKRKEELLNQIITRLPEVSSTFLDSIYGPTGLDIGAETPGEIAISILAELQSVYTKTTVQPLSEKETFIHNR